MKIIRKGNDIPVYISITKNSVPVVFDDSTIANITVTVKKDGVHKPTATAINRCSCTYNLITELNIEAKYNNNVLMAYIPAELQQFSGICSLIVQYTVTEKDNFLNGTRTSTFDIPDVFELVNTTEDSVDSDTTIRINYELIKK